MSSKTFTNERWALVLVPPPPSTASSSCSLTCTYTCSKLRCARPPHPGMRVLARPWGQQAPHFCSKKRPAAAANLLPICLGGSERGDASWVRVYSHIAIYWQLRSQSPRHIYTGNLDPRVPARCPQGACGVFSQGASGSLVRARGAVPSHRPLLTRLFRL